MPVVYVDDNFGRWYSERAKLVAPSTREIAPGAGITWLLAPRDTSDFVIKPWFSGFYSTNLAVLLPKLGASRLVLTGVSSDICILFAAGDAHMREYRQRVPRDAIAGEGGQRTEWAVEIVRNSVEAETQPTSAFSLEAWLGQTRIQPAASTG